MGGGSGTLLGVDEDHVVCETELFAEDDDFPRVGPRCVHVHGELLSMFGCHFDQSMRREGWCGWRSGFDWRGCVFCLFSGYGAEGEGLYIRVWQCHYVN